MIELRMFFLIDVVAEVCKESKELPSRTKRMSIKIGPSNFATRKKKNENHYI